MAAMGLRTFGELTGETAWLDQSKAIAHWKARGLDFSKIFAKPDVVGPIATRKVTGQDHGIDKILDRKLIAKAAPALEGGTAVEIESEIHNYDRTAGAMLSGEVASRFGHAGLPEDTITVKLNGVTGQSFGAWAAHGVTLDVTGEGNDYVGKGLSGGKIAVFPPIGSKFPAEDNIIIGNVALYGATSGEAYIRGMAGERFCVRNSGANAVVEGVGDHGCEYMTGGRVVVLGATGRNFGAGMSGGIAYVLDEHGTFGAQVNSQMVNVEQLTDDTEITGVRHMVERHLEHTSSDRARLVLDDWAGMVPKFVKVIPKDYQRMLAAIARAEEQGLVGDEAIMVAFEQNARDLARVGGN